MTTAFLKLSLQKSVICSRGISASFTNLRSKVEKLLPYDATSLIQGRYEQSSSELESLNAR